LVKDANDQDSGCLLAVEDYVAGVFDAPEIGRGEAPLSAHARSGRKF
jgi:hypothetical protein